MTSWTSGTLGGAIIGLAVSLMLFLNGRVVGVSGIASSLLKEKPSESFWRWNFLLGLLVGGVILRVWNPGVFRHFSLTQDEPGMSILAGLLVGIGTGMSGGCTSGHGVCGVSRFSQRSILATLVFVLAGMITVRVIYLLG